MEVFERDRKVDIRILRSRGCKGTIKCNYYTRDGSAHAPHDYEEKTGTLVFEQGEIEKTVTIGIVDDDEYEPQLVTELPDQGKQLEATGSNMISNILVQTPGQKTMKQRIYHPKTF